MCIRATTTTTTASCRGNKLLKQSRDKTLISVEFNLAVAIILEIQKSVLFLLTVFILNIWICPSSLLPLVSGTNSRLSSVNHALISPILRHPVLWVALPPSVTSTHHFHHPLPLHSSTPDLKPFFLQIPPTAAFLFLLQDWLHDPPDFYGYF